jgi:hypothetical protein
MVRRTIENDLATGLVYDFIDSLLISYFHIKLRPYMIINNTPVGLR